MPVVTIDYKPRSFFLPFHERTQRFACIVAHRRAGKTTACIQELQKAALTCKLDRPRFAYIAPFLSQAKRAAWDILKHAAAPLVPHGADIKEGEVLVNYPNGGQVRLYGADNPDSLRGIYLDGAVNDEHAQQDPTVWPEIIRPALTDRQGWATFIGTPKGRDAFYRIWREAETDNLGWYAAKFPVSLTKIIPEEELANARRMMSAAQYAREFECSFDEPDVDQFIDSLTVDAARNREVQGFGPRLLGVDVARHGDDRTVVIFRNGDKVSEEDITIWRGIDLMQTAGRVAEIIAQKRPQKVFVDGVGVGGGVVDRLKQLGFSVVDVNAGGVAVHEDRFFNLRAEMWGKMREWLKDKGSVPKRDDLADDLMAPSYEYDARNRLKLEKKEDMKARGLPSPDIADALALTFARPVSVDMPKSLVAKWSGPVAVADPLEGF